MTSQIYRVCADSLQFALTLPTSVSLPSANELRQRAMAQLDGMVGRGRALGLPDADVAEARYALVAFIDEQVLKSTWSGRAEWMSQPLQLVLYREYTAGENFFVRLRALLQSGTRPFALEAYYLCLALGFRGAYGVSGDTTGVSGFVESARRELGKRLPSTAKFGPHARARDLVGEERKSNVALVALVVGCVFLVLLVLAGLHFKLKSDLGEVLASAPTAPTAPPAPAKR